MKTPIPHIAVLVTLLTCSWSHAGFIDNFESYANGTVPTSNGVGTWSMLNNPAGSPAVVTSSGFPSTPDPTQALQFVTGDQGGKDLEFDITSDITTLGAGPMTLCFSWLAVDAAEGGTGVGINVRPVSGDGTGANAFPFQFSTLATSSTMLLTDGLGNNLFFTDAGGSSVNYSLGSWYQTLITMEQDAGGQWTASASVIDIATGSLLGSANAFTGKNLALDRLDKVLVSSSSNANQKWRIDAIKLDTVPEPASATLLLIGGLALLRRKK